MVGNRGDKKLLVQKMNIKSEEYFKLFSGSKNEYLSNRLFPNIYFEIFFNSDFLKEMLNEFPDLSINKIKGFITNKIKKERKNNYFNSIIKTIKLFI